MGMFRPKPANKPKRLDVEIGSLVRAKTLLTIYRVIGKRGDRTSPNEFIYDLLSISTGDQLRSVRLLETQFEAYEKSS